MRQYEGQLLRGTRTCVFDKFPKYHMKILLGDFHTKVGGEDIFKPTIGNESLHIKKSDSQKYSVPTS
jgi:hypothetical protein